MSHPTDHLADYVDGSISERERARVDAHLEGCTRCRDEVQAATRARSALADLPEIDVPTGVVAPVLREAGIAPTSGVRARRRAETPPGRVWGRVAVAAASIAAVAVAVFFFTAPRQESARTSSAEAAMVQGASPFMDAGAPDPGRMDHNGDYNGSELHALAEQTATRYAESRAIGDGAAAVAESPPEPEAAALPALDTSRDAPPEKSSHAAIADPTAFRRCLRVVGALDHNGALVDGFQADYLGDPVYLAVIVEGPAPDAARDRAVVWALGRDDCDVVAFSQFYFPPATPTPAPSTYLNPP